MPEEPTTPGGEPGQQFTQADLDRLAGQTRSETRDRTLREIEGEYGDLKVLKGAAEELQKLREERMSEQERREQRLTDLERQLEEQRANATLLEQSNLRLSVAVENQLPASLAGAITGSTRDEMSASAAKILEDIKSLGGERRPPAMDATAGKPAPRGTPSLTNEERQVARRFNMTDEQYLANKKAMLMGEE
jgi:hypothetical protein